MDEQRLIDIETKLAYQEDLLLTLNEIVATQQQQIDQLEQVCRSLIGHIKDMSYQLRDQRGTEHELPPHY
ncbi:SlyX family protein [Alcanivorax quisquiliarum]|uniref:SlyX family protein n=1 Tax=Alcanivorax quisquiliarum TaxID=2933565 RepID=A0ABT0E4Q1_9GAMM|nr:SlyX family protein [Alcanivorax quisquiliarum]